MNTRMGPWKLLWMPGILTIVISLLIVYKYWNYDIFYYYKQNLRSYFFTGFITAGSLSLSALTWTVVNLKEKLYGSEAYKFHFQKLVDAKACSLDDLYNPLWNIKSMLHWTVVACLSASFIQFSLGLVEENWAAMICIAFVIFAATTLLYSVFILKKALTNWFDWMKVDV